MSTATTSAHLMTCNKSCVAEIRKGLRTALAAFKGVRLTVQMGQGSTSGTCLVIVEGSNAATIAAMEWLKANHFEDSLTAHGTDGIDSRLARHREHGNERFDMNVMRRPTDMPTETKEDLMAHNERVRRATIDWITEAATAHDVYPFALPPIGPDVDLRLIISIAGEIVGAAVTEISKNMPKRRIAGPHECWPRSTDRPGYEWMGARKDWHQGHCVYDGDDDGETCIFCGEPEERK